jgi:hypothetical protein
MNSDRQLDGASAGAMSLRQLKDLQDELQVAISAIARNSLPDLELSLWRQEMLCAGLKRSLFVLARSTPGKEMLGHLRSETVSLQQVNLSYESLVQQSSWSMSLLQDLCSLYKNAPAHSILHALPSLSCEA